MPQTPTVIVFDVNETLSDLSPMADRFADIGVDRYLAAQWFAMLLRDGFALTAAGGSEKFVVLGEQTLLTMLSGRDLDRDITDAVSHVMDGFMALPVHPDVAAGVRELRAAGYRLITLTNGSVAVADSLFARAGIGGEFEALLSVEDAGAWKPARRAYQYAAMRCDVDPADLLLVAVHPWDIDGAARAGLSTVWVNRTGASYPAFFTPPTHTVSGLTDLAGLLPS